MNRFTIFCSFCITTTAFACSGFECQQLQNQQQINNTQQQLNQQQRINNTAQEQNMPPPAAYQSTSQTMQQYNVQQQSQTIQQQQQQIQTQQMYNQQQLQQQR